MKFMPSSGREDQSSWFGKHGIPWHITVAYRRDENGNFWLRTFVHMFDQTPQDSTTVIAIIKAVLKLVKQECPETTNAAF